MAILESKQRAASPFLAVIHTTDVFAFLLLGVKRHGSWRVGMLTAWLGGGDFRFMYQV